MIDREKLAALLNLAQVGADLGVALGQLRQPLQHGRAQLQGHPATGTLGAAQSRLFTQLHVKAPGGTMVPVSAFAHIEHSVVPCSLNRFQQLNALKLSGMSARTLDEALRFLETTAREVLPPGYGFDYYR
ncbi:MAG: hypothetical protein R3E68_01945 [Burkholderiaceae bacterium]